MIVHLLVLDVFRTEASKSENHFVEYVFLEQ